MPSSVEVAEAACICGKPISACPEGQQADAAIVEYLNKLTDKHVVLLLVQSQSTLKDLALRVAREVQAVRSPGWVTHFPGAEVEWLSDRQEDEPPYTTVYVGWDETHRGCTDHYNLIFPLSYLWEPTETVRSLETAAQRLRQIEEAKRISEADAADAARKEAADLALYTRLKQKFEPDAP